MELVLLVKTMIKTLTSMRNNDRIVATTVPDVLAAIARDCPLPSSSVSLYTRSTTKVSIINWAAHSAVFTITPIIKAVE